MLLEPCPTTLKNLGLQCGSQRNHGPWHSNWVTQRTTQRTPRRESRGGWRTNVCCGRPSQWSLICNQILVQCANPRGNHTIRTLPPGMAVEYARVHDEEIWNTAIWVLADIPGSDAERERARELASLPLRMGGLGLRSMRRCSRAAYWALWADALPMTQERNPAIAEIVENAMVHNVFPPEGCLSELVQATSQLDQEGSPNDQAGQNCAGASDRPRTHRRNPASGSTAGSIGHLPPPIVPLGRAPRCQASLPQTGHIFGPTQGAVQAWSLHMHPQLPSSLSFHICSGCCSWRGCASPCRSRRQRAVGAARHLTLAVSTEPRAPGLGG